MRTAVKFLVTAGDYYGLSGGVMAMHLLCDLLNRSGAEAYICAMLQSAESRPTSPFGGIATAAEAWARWHLWRKYRPLVTNPELKTPMLRDVGVVRRSSDWAVVYPEIVFGNPLGARNVVRWYLHHAGYHSGSAGLNRDELHVRYSDWQRLPQMEWCQVYPGCLRPFKIPAAYAPPAPGTPRQGTAYCLRKGAHREIRHDLRDSVLIDSLDHHEIAAIFRRVKTFISYDLYTTYSVLAVRCGAESIVVPDPQLSEEQWFPREEDRWGVAYGFEQVPRARETAERQRQRLEQLEEDSLRSVTSFAAYAERHFHAARKPG